MKILHLNGKPLYAVKGTVDINKKLVNLFDQGSFVGKVSMRYFDSQEGEYDTPQGRFQWLEVPYTVTIISDFPYRAGPDGYAQYHHKTKGWRSSATITNDKLTQHE